MMPEHGMRKVLSPPRREGLLSRIFPRLAARHEEQLVRLDEARHRRELIGQIGTSFAGYPGSKKDTPYSTWLPGGGSADEDVLGDLHSLRERSRDLVRSDPHAAGIVDCWVSNIVGHGITPQSRIDRDLLGLTEEKAQEFQRTAERIYRYWGRTADVTGRLSIVELQALLMRSLFENGDVFAIPRVDETRKISLAYQVIEADRVTTPPAKINDKSVREGIVVGPSGEHKSYYVKKTHPGDTKSGGWKTDDFALIGSTDEAGRRRILHLYRTLRPDQTRGVPFLAPALLLFYDLQQYFRAELIGAKVAACYSVFVVSKDPYGAAAAAASTARDKAGRPVEFLTPGQVRYLEQGEEIQGFQPNRPNAAFSDFVMRILRAIGAQVGMPYELVSQDFSQTTYTSGRMALTEVRRNFRAWQAWFAAKFLQPTWERVMEEAVLLGELDAPKWEEFRDAYTQVTWVGPGWQWVDPSKEVSSTIEAIDKNLTTLADECATRGADWQEVLIQRAREREVQEELGILPTVPIAGAPGAQAGDGNEGDIASDEEPLPDTEKETPDGKGD